MALEGWEAGLLMKNEARELLGRPGVDGGDVYKTSITDLFLRENDDPAKVSQAILQDGLDGTRRSGTRATGQHTADH